MNAHGSPSRTTLAGVRSSVRRYFTQTIWGPLPPRSSAGARALRRAARFLSLLVRGFRDHRIMARAPALTLAYLLALVPMLALVLLGASFFGLRETALGWLQHYLAEYVTADQHEVIDVVTRSVEQVNVVALGGVGLVFLLVTAFDMLSTVETAFNDIWGVSAGRPIHRKVIDYLAALLVFPVLIFASSAAMATLGSLKIVEGTGDVAMLSGMIGFALRAVPFLSIVLGFTFIYKLMPHTWVRFRSAAIAGCAAGLAWYVAQWAFIEFQIGVSSNNALYGALAALPIFLVWLNTSWIIVLLGCEVAYAAQHESSYRPPVPGVTLSISERECVALQVVARVWERSVEGLPPETAGEIAARAGLPRPVTTEIIDTLGRCRTLRVEGQERTLSPTGDLGGHGLGDLLVTFRQAGRAKPSDAGGFVDERIRERHRRMETEIRDGAMSTALRALLGGRREPCD
jgi:membrane protein